MKSKYQCDEYVSSVQKGDEERIHIFRLPDGGQTVVCGAWILLRKSRNGKIRIIDSDAPAQLLAAARKAVTE